MARPYVALRPINPRIEDQDTTPARRPAFCGYVGGAVRCARLGILFNEAEAENASEQPSGVGELFLNGAVPGDVPDQGRSSAYRPSVENYSCVGSGRSTVYPDIGITLLLSFCVHVYTCLIMLALFSMATWNT